MRWLLLPWIVVAAYYTTVEEGEPRCRRVLGPRYCPAAAVWSDEYMSWPERTHMTLLNAARLDPTGFHAMHDAGSAWPCGPTSARPACTYDPDLHQAAKQQAWLLSQPGCPFQHDTCPRFCYLYHGDCRFDRRVRTYYEAAVSENIAMAGRRNPLLPLLLFARSPGHCENMFDPAARQVGVGHVDGRYWVEVWGHQRNDTPLPSGSHWLGAPLAPEGSILFLVNSYHKPTVVVGGKAYPMRPYLDGTYQFRLVLANSCIPYYFLTAAGARLPETGVFYATCDRNWGS